MHLQIAWRNLWRNTRRTAVILMAVIVGVWSMIFLGSLMTGISEQMVRNAIATLTGSLQVHAKGYRADPTVTHSIRNPEEVEKVLAETLPESAEWTQRIRVDAIAQNARHSGALTLVGIDPEQEAAVSFIGGAVAEGTYLEPGDDHGILIGRALADSFETRIGHKLVLMSQTLSGEMASRAFRIVGIFRAEMEATEKGFVFATRPAVGKMLKLEGGVSEFSVLLSERADAASMAETIGGRLSDQYTVHDWRTLLPTVNAYIKINGTSTRIWYFVVFIAMGFGVVNTMLMAVYERMREFGLLKALGMKPWWIIRGVLTEAFLVLLIGLVVGNLLAFGTVFLVAQHGIDLSAMSEGAQYAGMARVIFPVLAPDTVLFADLVVLVLGVLVSLYPAWKAARFTPVEAMAHH